MGLFDRLKKWAEDKVDDVEEALDDAGSYIKEKAEDLAGENTWASKIIDKIDDYIPSSEEIIDTASDAVGDYVGGEIKGTWAEDAASTVKDALVSNGSEITDAAEFRTAMNVARRGQVTDIVDVLRRTDLTKVLARRGVRSVNGHDDVLIVRA